VCIFVVSEGLVPDQSASTIEPSTSENPTQDQAEDQTEEDYANLTWSNAMVLLLLDCYQRHAYKFQNPTKKKKYVWKDIVSDFNVKGHNLTWMDVERKFRNLKGTYRKIIEKKGEERRGSRKVGKVRWPYLEFFETMYGHDLASLNADIGLHMDVVAGHPNDITASFADLQEVEDAADDVTSFNEKGSRSRRTRKRRAEKTDCPDWFADFLADFRQRDDARRAQEDKRLKLLEEMCRKQAQQASEHNDILKNLNCNIKALIDKM